jgi:hypothetical protein
LKFANQSIREIGLLFATVALLSISMAAQQEVSPDHFDDNPVVVKKSKPAPKAQRVAAKKPSPATHVAVKPKTPVQPESATSTPAPVQTASNR